MSERRRTGLCAALAAVAALLLALPAQSAPAAGPQGGEGAPGRRQLWLIPSTVPNFPMHAFLFRPPGAGPFPLALINHGSDQGDSLARTAMPMPAYPVLTDWFLARGYAVLVPERPGHGETEGPYLEDQGTCDDADYVRAGKATADSIAAALAYMLKQPFIRPGGAVVAGHSAGAWGGLALAARNPATVSAIVNFSGGRGGRQLGRANSNCSPDRLVSAAREFGRTARVRTLWLYAANDTYFAPDLSKRMADAFKSAGGRVEYHLLPAVGPEGHALIQAPPGVAAWPPYLAAFLGDR